MKEIIILLDTGDSRFLIEKKNNIYIIPMIRSKELINIDQKIYRKYKIRVKKEFVIVEQGEDFYFIKCIIDGCVKYDKNIFEVKVVNEMIQVVSSKFQKQLLLDLSTKIGIEICNDAFWLEVITKTYDCMKDDIVKRLLFDFLAQFSSSFCKEVLEYKYGKENEAYERVVNREVKNMRETYFKVCPTADSDHMKLIMRDMGISFDNNDFNICLFFNNKVLIDVNSRTWKSDEKYDDYCHIILSPVRWIKNLNLKECENLKPLCAMMIHQFTKMFDDCNGSYRVYSVNRLFANNLSENEKIYIMQRIGLIKTVMFFSEKFSSGLQFLKGFPDSNKFLLKVKATLICMIGVDKKKINFLDEMFNEYLKDIPDEFYPINRKCRNNIHYGFYNELTEHDLEVLDKYQDIYLKHVIELFEKELTLNFGVKYHFDLTLAKIQYWASHKN